MRLRRIIIDKDSKGTIIGLWLFLAVLAALACLFIGCLWIRIPVLLLLLALAFFVFWFHRVPDRDITEGDGFWPMSGRISYYKYHPGRYLLAFLPKASEKNEHSSTAIANQHGEIFFKQIAGTFARRIVCYSKEGDQVERGKQCGIIKFGSRIDIFLPLDAEILVSEGEFTKACITPIARLK